MNMTIENQQIILTTAKYCTVYQRIHEWKTHYDIGVIKPSYYAGLIPHLIHSVGIADDDA